MFHQQVPARTSRSAASSTIRPFYGKALIGCIESNAVTPPECLSFAAHRHILEERQMPPVACGHRRETLGFDTRQLRR